MTDFPTCADEALNAKPKSLVIENGELGFYDNKSGCFITDPELSSCGRFMVDPKVQYGITTEQFETMTAARTGYLISITGLHLGLLRRASILLSIENGLRDDEREELKNLADMLDAKTLTPRNPSEAINEFTL